jgi:pyruvate carboxylase subunit B
MEDVLNEIPRVRKDMGYPPLVTPTSQIVGTQAVMNVLTGERYKTITNETKLYFEGRYGHTPAEVDHDVCKKAIGDTPVIDLRPADLLKDEMEDMKKSAGDLAESIDDVLIVAMFPDIGYEFLQQRHDNTLVPEPLLPASSNKEKISAATEFNITVHGETYAIKVMGTGHEAHQKRPFYLTVDGMPEEAMVEAIHEIPFNNQSGIPGQPRASKPGDVTASMPCTIVEVMVKEGDEVNAGDDLLVTEAMKMETAIQAPISGTILRVNVTRGDTVNPDDALIEIS